MSRPKKLPAYANGIIYNEVYDTGALTEYCHKLNEGLKCSPCYRTKPKASLLKLLLRKQE